MKRRKLYEFKPDPVDSGWRSRLYLTKKQRYTLMRWVMYSGLLLLLSLLQDVVMSRLRIMGGTTDLVSTGIFLIALLQTPDTGSIFALISTLLFYFSGAAPGVYTIALLPVLSVLLNILRHGLLSKRFRSIFLCAGIGLMVYELAVFGLGLFLGSVSFSRIYVFVITGILSVAVLPLLYPIAFSIGKIGGETWKD